MRLLVIAAAVLIAPAAAVAHDFWIEPAGDGFTVRYGHRGGEVLAIDAAKVEAIRCADGAGMQRDVLAAARFAPTEVQVVARCDVISAFHHGGFYSLTPDGEVNRPKNQVANAVKAWESRQFAKWIDHKPLGETDSAGEVRIRLRATGIESVSASVRRPVSTPEADALVLEASLTFAVAK